jgi:protein-tyrosine phosphatase
VPQTLIDIHCHLLPGIDDGCRDLDDSLACIRRLIQAGYAGSICSPHIVPAEFPLNDPPFIAAQVEFLRQAVAEAKLPYKLWPGAELRLSDDVVAWMGVHGVPTLADSNCVLCDFWDPFWPAWVNKSLRWLLDQHCQPILAHPERLPIRRDLDRRLEELARMGVWFQGNFACLTGSEGADADRLVRQGLEMRRYQFMALDVHRPDTLGVRLDGLAVVAAEFGPELVAELAGAAPQRLILSRDAADQSPPDGARP